MGSLLCHRHPGQPRRFCPRCAANYAVDPSDPRWRGGCPKHPGEHRDMCRACAREHVASERPEPPPLELTSAALAVASRISGVEVLKRKIGERGG